MSLTWLCALDFVVGGESQNLINDVLLDSIILEENGHQDRDVGNAEDVDSVVGQNLPPTLLTVEKDESCIDDEALAS